MNPIQKIYILAGLIAFAISIYFIWADRKSFSFLSRKYLLFLQKPWKLLTMGFAVAFVTLVGPYSGDYTWDYVDGFIMSILTCFTAPWVVGTFYKFKIKQVSFKYVFVAFCFWMFSVSWFFEMYIFLRDGYYPTVWLPNIVLSSMLYWCAGLLWNLDWSPSKGAFLSFISGDEWFQVSKHRVFLKIMKKGWVYIAIVAFLFGEVIYALHHEGQFFP